jgi:hypothetical protein
MTKPPRLIINVGEQKAWLDGKLLDLSPNEFAALVLLAETRKGIDTDAFVSPEQLQKVMTPGANVESVMVHLTSKMEGWL